MGPNEKLFKKQYAKELFKIAENDFVTSKVLAKAQEVRRETVLFLIEQTIEKSLKALLCHKGLPIPFTHDLYALVQRFEVDQLPPGGYALHDLTPFASIRRYEEGNYIIEEEDIQHALSIAESVLSWAKELINK
ncbi:MAG TPA: HEPN domain-containing protein [Pseudobdellovibrionaceae bacterium]|nr:HEPN domain-containing protein [Pseudobdellovibrionaceae bacterium]